MKPLHTLPSTAFSEKRTCLLKIHRKMHVAQVQVLSHLTLSYWLTFVSRAVSGTQPRMRLWHTGQIYAATAAHFRQSAQAFYGLCKNANWTCSSFVKPYYCILDWSYLPGTRLVIGGKRWKWCVLNPCLPVLGSFCCVSCTFEPRPVYTQRVLPDYGWGYSVKYALFRFG